jgi:hypothetical protein
MSNGGGGAGLEARGEGFSDMEGEGMVSEGMGLGTMPGVSCKDEVGEETPSGTTGQGGDKNYGVNCRIRASLWILRESNSSGERQSSVRRGRPASTA